MCRQQLTCEQLAFSAGLMLQLPAPANPSACSYCSSCRHSSIWGTSSLGSMRTPNLRSEQTERRGAGGGRQVWKFPSEFAAAMLPSGCLMQH